MKVKNNEILNTQGRAILLDVCGQRQLQVCQNPNLLWGVPVVAGSKAQEERDGGRLSAGGEMPVLLMVMENKKKKYGHSAGMEVPTAVA